MNKIWNKNKNNITCKQYMLVIIVIMLKLFFAICYAACYILWVYFLLLIYYVFNILKINLHDLKLTNMQNEIWFDFQSYLIAIDNEIKSNVIENVAFKSTMGMTVGFC